MAKISLKQRRKLKKRTNSNQGGKIAQLMALTPLMRKKIEENRTIFGDEKLLEKAQIVQMMMKNSENNHLKIEKLIYKKQNRVLSRKIDREYIWNQVLKSDVKSKEDYQIVAKELMKEYLDTDEEYVKVDFDTYSKVIKT